MSTDFPAHFQRKAVEPVACIKGGWNLVRGQYWLFVGIILVAMLLNGVVPFWILLGPTMCGIYICLFRRQAGEPVEFGILFKGFDYFGPSLLATLLHQLTVLVIMLPVLTVLMLAGLLFISAQQWRESNPALMILAVVLFALAGLFIVCLMIVFHIASTFVYPLIVDRKLSGPVAVKLSTKAALANFWQILGLMLLNALLALAGALFCYVGLFLALPICFGSVSIAYQQVFGLATVRSAAPPPPPVFS